MKDFRVIKMDRRHRACGQFTHYIEPVWSTQLADKIKFFEWRNWCWQTWGPGMERDIAVEFGSNEISDGFDKKPLRIFCKKGRLTLCLM